MFPGKALSISPWQKSSAHNPCKRCRQQPYSGSNITLYRDDKCPERSVSGHKPLPAIKPSPGNPFGRPTGTGGGEVRRLRTQSTLTAPRELPKKRVEAKKLRPTGRTQRHLQRGRQRAGRHTAPVSRLPPTKKKQYRQEVKFLTNRVQNSPKRCTNDTWMTPRRGTDGVLLCVQL